jgi:hypothetical protein
VPGITSVKACPGRKDVPPAYIGDLYNDQVSKIQNGDYKMGNLIDQAYVRTINNAFLRECETQSTSWLPFQMATSLRTLRVWRN